MSRTKLPLLLMINQKQLQFNLSAPHYRLKETEKQKNCKHRYIYVTTAILPELDDTIEEFVCKKCGQIQD
ncbi:MAG: hypothetical protein ABH896_01875 [Candidatus Jacksonbacteria bacterium]